MCEGGETSTCPDDCPIGVCMYEKLTPGDTREGDLFGGSVTVDRGVAIIGAPLSDGDAVASGSAQVFSFNGRDWSEMQRLTAPDAAAFDTFGWSVDAKIPVLIVGAPFIPGVPSRSGSAYIFRRNTAGRWGYEQKLGAPVSLPGNQFGFAVAVDGNVALVGARGDDSLGDQSGASYVFRFNGASWVQEATLTASDGIAHQQFGWAVSLSRGVADRRVVRR